MNMDIITMVTIIIIITVITMDMDITTVMKKYHIYKRSLRMALTAREFKIR